MTLMIWLRTEQVIEDLQLHVSIKEKDKNKYVDFIITKKGTSDAESKQRLKKQ